MFQSKNSYCHPIKKIVIAEYIANLKNCEHRTLFVEITHLQLNFTYRKACNWGERVDLAVTFFQCLVLPFQKDSCEPKQGLVLQVMHLDLLQITTERVFQLPGFHNDHKLLKTSLSHQKPLWQSAMCLNVDSSIKKIFLFFNKLLLLHLNYLVQGFCLFWPRLQQLCGFVAWFVFFYKSRY